MFTLLTSLVLLLQCYTCYIVQELKKKELDELDAIFSELGISVEEQAKRDAEAEKKRKKKEKKKAAANGDEAAAANGSSAEQQQQQPAAAAPAEEAAAEQEEEPSGEAIDPAAVSLIKVLQRGTRGDDVMLVPPAVHTCCAISCMHVLGKSQWVLVS
jgi:hypothetical protein